MSTTTYAVVGALLAIAAASVLFLPTGLTQWLRKKNYQYEVTSSLYMLTPTEKFIFNTILLLTTSMLTIATILYLPNHVAIICRRAYYYFAGDTNADLSRTVASQLGDRGREFAGAVVDAAVNTKMAMEEGVKGAAESLGWS